MQSGQREGGGPAGGLYRPPPPRKQKPGLPRPPHVPFCDGRTSAWGRGGGVGFRVSRERQPCGTPPVAENLELLDRDVLASAFVQRLFDLCAQRLTSFTDRDVCDRSAPGRRPTASRAPLRPPGHAPLRPSPPPRPPAAAPPPGPARTSPAL